MHKERNEVTERNNMRFGGFAKCLLDSQMLPNRVVLAQSFVNIEIIKVFEGNLVWEGLNSILTD